MILILHIRGSGGSAVLNTINFSCILEEIKGPKRILKSQQFLAHHCYSVMMSHSIADSPSSHFPILLPNPQHYLTVKRESYSPLSTFSLIIYRPWLHVFSEHSITWRAGLTMHYASYLLFGTFSSLLYIQFQDLLSLKFSDLSLKCRNLRASFSLTNLSKFGNIFV